MYVVKVLGRRIYVERDEDGEVRGVYDEDGRPFDWGDDLDEEPDEERDEQ